MGRRTTFPKVVAFRVTDEEQAEIDAALVAYCETRVYAWERDPKRLRASWLRKLVLHAIRGDELPVAREAGVSESLPPKPKRARRGS